MKLWRQDLVVFVGLLLAAAAPLRAQFSTAGCPAGLGGPQLNGFTAGSGASSEICLTGTFAASVAPTDAAISSAEHSFIFPLIMRRQ